LSLLKTNFCAGAAVRWNNVCHAAEANARSRFAKEFEPDQVLRSDTENDQANDQQVGAIWVRGPPFCNGHCRAGADVVCGCTRTAQSPLDKGKGSAPELWLGEQLTDLRRHRELNNSIASLTAASPISSESDRTDELVTCTLTSPLRPKRSIYLFHFAANGILHTGSIKPT
jgi:hypothetical protein